MIGHIKSVFLTKEGGEIQANDVDLTGKIRTMTCADMDAIGLLKRVKNQTILSFKTAEDDMICGARNEHLRDQEFVVCEYIDGKFIYHWDKIFI